MSSHAGHEQTSAKRVRVIDSLFTGFSMQFFARVVDTSFSSVAQLPKDAG
jgi:hypothetical protein